MTNEEMQAKIDALEQRVASLERHRKETAEYYRKCDELVQLKKNTPQMGNWQPPARPT
jgi:hypothetical protein